MQTANNTPEWLFCALGMPGQGAKPKITAPKSSAQTYLSQKKLTKDYEYDSRALPASGNNLSEENNYYVQTQVHLRQCTDSIAIDIEEDSVPDVKVDRALDTTHLHKSDCLVNSGDQNYGDIKTRLATFPENWKYECKISKHDLAKYGWIWTGKGNKVMCFHCKGTMHNWKQTQTALGEHKRLYPDCEFICSVLDDVLSSPNRSPSLNSQHNTRSSTSRVVKTAKDFGYSEDAVNRVVAKLRRASTAVTTDTILDELFNTQELPGTENSSEPAQTPSNESPHPATDGTTSQTDINGASANSDTMRNTNNDLNSVSSNNTPNKYGNRRPTQKCSASIEDRSRPVMELSEVVQHMETDNKQWKERITCKVCLDAQVGVLFLPCRHLICCTDCASSVNTCPLCRAQIVATIKAYL